MTEPSRNNAGTTRGRPFPPGNPGRPKGARHKVTQAMEALLAGEGEALTRRAIDMALAGDAVALRLCLDRLLPTLRERPVAVELPPLTGPKDAVAASAALLAAVTAGEIAPGEAREIGRLLELHLKALELHNIDARLAALESKQPRTRAPSDPRDDQSPATPPCRTGEETGYRTTPALRLVEQGRAQAPGRAG
jgi:hypothetical protein